MPQGFSLSRSNLPATLFILLDILTSYLTAHTAFWLRFSYVETSFNYQSLSVIHAFLVVGTSGMFGVYQSWRGRSLSYFLGIVIFSWVISFTLLVAFLVMTKSTEQYSRLWLGSWIVLSILLSIVFRILITVFLRSIRIRGRNSKRVLVIGRGRNFYSIIHEMGHRNEWGYRLDACLEYDQLSRVRELVESQLKKDSDFDECWLCLPLKDSTIIEEILFTLRYQTMDIRYMPGLRDMALLNHRVTPIGGFYSLDLSCSPLNEWNSMIKRIEDVMLSLVAIFIASPVMLAIAFLVKITSEGPVLFKQRRLGANGEQIEVYKFRTMYVHNEADGKVTQAVKNDQRLTSIGGFLRRNSLDELPQFLNVLKGNMSVVGPRPHALAHNEQYKELVDSYMKRHKVKPGITGLAQVNGFRGETDTLAKMQKRVEMDLKYINSWSLSLDFKIICLTVYKSFSDTNAY
ncbi:undecaprenyl-phosphate glucose phosphotransferase [Endozoicomonas lisbonensis]|uniref:Colanic acid biosynthesis UDP-glucose lipid carrier transferase n=1 Tax=Endozoicomonas lisbonensis TaxID=3120522 RepID=A0ABV2SMM7_9GAMM